MKKITTLKERILQYLDFKGITKNKFYTQTGVSNGILDKSGGISTETLEKIINKYSEISIEWLMTGEGEMLKPEKYEVAENHFVVSEPNDLNDNMVADYVINNWEEMLSKNKRFKIWYDYITMKAITEAYKK